MDCLSGVPKAADVNNADVASEAVDNNDIESKSADGVTTKSTLYRLFDFCGGVEVIAVPFVEGSHVPESMAHLIYAAKFLKKMHDANYVHGDIRLLNMMFTDKPEDSKLIDFDFGGRVASDLVYPPGYVQLLEDGKRVGVPHEPIFKRHDVDALIKTFHPLLSKQFTGEWENLFYNETNDEYTIEKVIAELENMRGISIKMEISLKQMLERNSKLSRGGSNQHTNFRHKSR